MEYKAVLNIITAIALTVAIIGYASPLEVCSSTTIKDEIHIDCSKKELNEFPNELSNRNTHNVTSINLSWNNLWDANPVVIDRFTDLKQLILTGNRNLSVYVIHEQLRNVTVSPRKLSLDRTTRELTEINDNVFCINFYKHVTHLTLRANYILRIRFSSFNCVPNIQFLALGYSQLFVLDLGIRPPPHWTNIFWYIDRTPLPYVLWPRLRVIDISNMFNPPHYYAQAHYNDTIDQLFLGDEGKVYPHDLPVRPVDSNLTQNKLVLERVYAMNVDITGQIGKLLTSIKVESVRFIDLSYSEGFESVPDSLQTFPTLEVLKCTSCSIKQLPNDIFTNSSNLLELYLSINDLGISANNFPEIFQPLHKLKHLFIANNKITFLPRNTFLKLASLVLIDLSENNLLYVETIFPSQSMEYLKLEGNNLQDDFLSLEVRHNLSGKINTTILITVGPELICSCSSTYFFEWVSNNDDIFVPIDNSTMCSFNEKTLLLSEAHGTLSNAQECAEMLSIILACAVVSGIIVVALSICIYKYRIYIRWILYKCKHVILRNKYSQIIDQHLFDVYISVANEDLRFAKTIVEYLEENHAMKAYLYERDSIGGEAIHDNIFYGLVNSACVIVILSPHFTRDEMRDWELSMAVASRKSRMVIVKTGDIESSDLSGILKSLLLPAPSVTLHEWSPGTCGDGVLLDALRDHVKQYSPNRSHQIEQTEHISQYRDNPNFEIELDQFYLQHLGEQNAAI